MKTIIPSNQGSLKNIFLNGRTITTFTFNSKIRSQKIKTNMEIVKIVHEIYLNEERRISSIG